MGNGCTRCCGKIQDYCRDSCGCCPCDCCKTAKVEMKAEQIIEHEIKKQEIPFGSTSLHAGIRVKDDTYTSPVLEILTWRQSTMQRTKNEIAGSQRVALGGMQTERDNADHYLGLTRGTDRRQLEMEAELVVIPVESIISIKYSSEMKKGQTQVLRVLMETPEKVELSCCGTIGDWCEKTFCCCCKNSDKRIRPKPERIVPTITNQEAERKIVLTIEYIHYSNIHTPSHVRVLSVPNQTEFYKENLHTDIVKFYLLDSRDFEQNDYDFIQLRATILCRLVTQVKAMIGNYPDESTLQKMIDGSSIFAIGDVPKESIERLTGPGQMNTQIQFKVPFSAIQNRS